MNGDINHLSEMELIKLYSQKVSTALEMLDDHAHTDKLVALQKDMEQILARIHEIRQKAQDSGQ